jgi:Zn-dependent protease
MSQMVEGGRSIAKFRAFGFPVSVDISFLIIVGILGWYSGLRLQYIAIWVVVTTIAVLTHELGHAFVARTTGAEPVITLAGLGGLTSYVPPKPVSRARSVAISVAGPAVGIVIGLTLLMVRATADPQSDFWSTVLRLGIFTTLGWSLLNLLPILPLDGGQTLRELLPGGRAKREVRAAMVSIVVSVLVGIVAFRAGYVFGTLMVLFLVASNVMTIRQARELKGVDVNRRISALLWAGRVDEARELASENLRDLSDVVRLVMTALEDDGQSPGAGAEARRRVAQSAQDPRDPSGSTVAVLVARARGDWPAVRDLVATTPVLGTSAVSAAQNAAHREGRHREVAEVGQAFLDRTLPAVSDGADLAAYIAFNTACGWASVGDLDRGFAALRRAVDLGFADLTTIDSDDEIAPLRPLPGYDDLRRQVRDRALAAAGDDAETSQPPPASPPG